MSEIEKMSYKLAIVGSRTFSDQEKMDGVMKDYIESHGKPSLVISGGAKGADTLGRLWAQRKGIPIKEFIPNWSKYGKMAGIHRNSDIVDNCDHLIAFQVNNSQGTQDSINKANKRKIHVLVIKI